MKGLSRQKAIGVLIAALIVFQGIVSISYRSFFHVSEMISYVETLHMNSALAIGVTNDSYENETDFYLWHDRDPKAFRVYDESRGLTQSVNAVFMQEVDETLYTRASFINDHTVQYGIYQKLTHHEIAISSIVSERYDLYLGDQLFIKGKSDVFTVMIAYVYRDINRIVGFDETFTTGSILLSSEIDLQFVDSEYLHFMDNYEHAYVEVATKEDHLQPVMQMLNRVFLLDSIATILTSIIVLVLHFRLSLPLLSKKVWEGCTDITRIFFRRSWVFILSYHAIMLVLKISVYQKLSYSLIFTAVLLLVYSLGTGIGLSRIRKRIHI